MRISDWSSDVCSSDLGGNRRAGRHRLMRALAKNRAEPGLEIIDAPVPTPGPGEVQPRIEAASVCGTHRHLTLWERWAAENIQARENHSEEQRGAGRGGIGRISILPKQKNTNTH